MPERIINLKKAFGSKYVITNTKIVFWAIFVFCCQTLSAQNYSEFKKILSEKRTPETSIDSVIKIYSYQEKDSLPFIYQKYFIYLFTKKNYEKASYYAEKAVKHMSKNDSVSLQKYYYSLGISKLKEKKHNGSARAFESSLNYSKDSIYALEAYKNLAYLYKLQNQYYLSIKYWDLVIAHYQSNQNAGRLKEAYYYCADVLKDTEDYNAYIKGQEYISKADSLISVTKTSAEQYYAIKLIGAGLYNTNQTLNIPKAESLLQQVLVKANKNKDSSTVATTFSILGNLYNSTNKEKSLHYLKKALQYREQQHDTIGLITSYVNLGYTHNYYSEFDEGLKHQYHSLELLLNQVVDTKTIKLIAKEQFKNVKRPKALLSILPEIAETYLKMYTEQRNLEHLDKSLFFFDLADKAIDMFIADSKENQSKLFWRKQSSDLYNKAIKACLLKEDLDLAFYYMEKNKMLVLLENIAVNKYQQTLNLSSPVIKQLNSLKEELTALENQSNPSNTDKEKILLLKRQLNTLNDSIGINQKRLLNDLKILPFNELQQTLSQDEIRISYHMSSDDGYGIYSNKTNGYLLYASQSQSQLIEIQNIDSLKKDVTELVTSFKSPTYKKDHIQKQKQLSLAVYNKLFPTEELQQLLKGKKLIISPDHFLSFLPFDALYTTQEEGSYLIQEAEVSYAPSHTFLQSLDGVPESSSGFLAMAPGEFKHSNLSQLSYSLNEATLLNDYYEGELILEKHATKDYFMNSLNAPSIIHLSTHAGSQDENKNPWIAFYDQKLNTDELKLIKNNADLVFLSGCETNLGKLEVGEGVMNLARVFFYGGAQSVVSSLWNIDDKSSSIIVNDFYKNLSKGKTKAASLRAAKLTYLKNSSLSEKSPYYWSSFVLLGNNHTLPNSSNGKIYILIFTLFIGLVLFLYFRYKRRTQSIT